METANLRSVFINELMVIAENDKRIAVLDPDVGSATYTWDFGQKYPKQFYELGIAEQNTFGVAAGLAAAGCKVVAATFAVFASMRAAEMIRTSICYPKLNVKVIGGYAGLSNGKDGATHQSVEDIAIMRSFPNMTVLIPSDTVTTRKIARAALEYDGPVYIRMEYEDLPAVYDENMDFRIGKGYRVREGKDCTVVSYGTALHRALQATEELLREGISLEVIDMPSLKPFDEDLLVESVRKTGALITIEDHNIFGGLASIACEYLFKNSVLAGFKPLAIKDLFTESGKTSELRDKYGIGKKDIIQAVRELKKRGDKR
jgi:transketolase